METKSVLEGKICIVKFYDNPDKNSKNKLITRSLGKMGFISTAWMQGKIPDEIPLSTEFWKVRIIKETEVGCGSGCFVLQPLEKLYVTDLERLLPGMYKEEYINNVLIIKALTVHSRKSKGNWILPLVLRKNTTGVYAIIVDLIESKGEQYERNYLRNSQSEISPNSSYPGS